MASSPGPARFGTDGVRGVANQSITAELALSLARATARAFAADRVVIGSDTRRSSAMLQSAAAAGVAAEGADAVVIGVAPTPAVAAECARLGVPGIVVSASHNPFGDNGLKVFGPGGRKLDDALQSRIEELLAQAPPAATAVLGAAVGEVHTDEGALARYGDHVLAALDGRRLDGLRVVVDSANGAAHRIAPEVLTRAGASVVAVGDRPDGTNINDGCGSTAPELVARTVVDEGADLGVALDGDADRLVAVDHQGRVVDGDHIIALCALDLRSSGRLVGDKVVVTVMSNLGFHRAMRAAGVEVIETPVGDRHVLDALQRHGGSLGGEQSGHIIFTDHATTGDGLLAAVLLADLVARSGRPLADLADDAMTSLPQVLRNVPVDAPMPDVADRIADELAAVAAELGDGGRVLVRPSGTEPVVRVMVEADTEERAEQCVSRLVAAVGHAAAPVAGSGG